MNAKFLSLLISTLALLAVASTAWAGGIPDLPREFAPKAKSVTFLQFSAPWCQSCKELQPTVNQLKLEQGKKLHVVYLNVEKAENEKYVNQFDLVSIPTYYLYSASGKPIRRIDGDVSPAQLQKWVREATAGAN